jgi:CheY-like chemotaxis protein
VTVAEDGKVATEYVEAEDYDLVLMDIRMPVMDGLEATKLIRGMNTDKSKIPIIALTADIATGNIVEYTSIGMDDVCAKPLDLGVLLKSINKQLGEEIHTSIPNALSATPERENIDTEEDAEPRDDSTFAQVLERVGAMADQASSIGSETTEPPSEIAIMLGDKFAELLAGYEKNLIEQCDNLKEAVAEVAKNPTDPDLKARVKTIAHTIKGGGGTFGYNLITTIATKADNLVSGNDVLAEQDLYTLNDLSDALKLVADKKMSGNAGKAGRILLQELEDFS